MKYRSLYNDYYPFGMLMPNRHESSSKYRYGFQGQEKDDEIKGEGNSYTATFWSYSPRVGKRWNTDPVIKVHESSYATFANNPIWFRDLIGKDTISINGSNGKTLRFIHPKLPKYSTNVDTDIGQDKTFDFTGKVLPDAIGYNVEVSLKAGAYFSGTGKAGVSYVIFTKGDYKLQPFKYLYGGYTFGKLATGESATITGGISPFAANFTGNDKDIIPKTWTQGFKQLSVNATLAEELGVSVGGTYFSSFPFDKKIGGWEGLSFDLSVDLGVGASITMEGGVTYYFNTEQHITKSDELMSSSIGIARMTLKWGDFSTMGQMPGVQGSDVLKENEETVKDWYNSYDWIWEKNFWK